jgi:hypothetical protein
VKVAEQATDLVGQEAREAGGRVRFVEVLGLGGEVGERVELGAQVSGQEGVVETGRMGEDASASERTEPPANRREAGSEAS